MADWLEQIQTEAASIIPPRSAVLLAVSGGLDSMVLATAMAQTARANRWRLVIGHFNHRLRGKESVGDQRFVERFSKKHNIPCICSAWERNEQAIQEHGLEMAAREARYTFLNATARRRRCRYLVTAHHADDQAETFLWKLMRGAGGLGLGGMEPLSQYKDNADLQLARPLLHFSKSDLAQCAQTNRIRYREDASNLSAQPFRNKIRLKLLPYLKKHFHPEVQYPILQSQNIVGEDADYARQAARAWLDDPNTPFSGLHVAVQRWIIWQQLVDLDLDPQYFQIESLRREAHASFSIDPTRRLHRDEEGKVCLTEHQPNEFLPNKFVLEPTARWQSVQFGQVQIKCRLSSRIPKKFSGETFDARSIPKRIILRHWQPGDRFQPIGNDQPSKLQDLFTNAKVSAADKRQRVLALNEHSQPFWVQGLRIGESAKVHRQTRRYLLWNWQKV